MNQKLVRLNSADGLEMPGILFTPDAPTDKIMLHVHGINGNFYENRFIDHIAKAYADRGFAFLPFDNRGKGYGSDRFNGNDCVYTGAMFERFKDSLLDLDGAVSWAKEQGYKEIILHGHSYGCNKVLYYYAKRRDPAIKCIMILSPCDVPGFLKLMAPADKYEKACSEAERLMAEGQPDTLIEFPCIFNSGKVSAGTFTADFTYDGENDFLRYREGAETDNELLNSIDIPVFACFGTLDNLVVSQPQETVEGYLKHNIKNLELKVIDGANHGFQLRYAELAAAAGAYLDSI